MAPSLASAGCAAIPSVVEVVAQQGNEHGEHRDAPEPEAPAEQHQAKVEGDGRKQAEAGLWSARQDEQAEGQLKGGQ